MIYQINTRRANKNPLDVKNLSHPPGSAAVSAATLRPTNPGSQHAGHYPAIGARQSRAQTPPLRIRFFRQRIRPRPISLTSVASPWHPLLHSSKWRRAGERRRSKKRPHSPTPVPSVRWQPCKYRCKCSIVSLTNRLAFPTFGSGHLPLKTHHRPPWRALGAWR